MNMADIFTVDLSPFPITHNPENKLKEYIDYGGRGKERPNLG